jgi:hypothetical protein
MDPQDVAASAVEPGEHDDLVAHADVGEPLGVGGLEGEPGVRSALATLLRRGRRVRQRGLHLADRREAHYAYTAARAGPGGGSARSRAPASA